MTRIVTSTYRYKRPPRKRKAVALDVPAIVTIDPKTRVAKKGRGQAFRGEAAAEITMERPPLRTPAHHRPQIRHRRRATARLCSAGASSGRWLR